MVTPIQRQVRDTNLERFVEVPHDDWSADFPDAGRDAAIREIRPWVARRCPASLTTRQFKILHPPRSQ